MNLDVEMAPRKRAIAKSFNCVASQYESKATIQKTVGHCLLSILPRDNMPDIILDVGCGTGYLTQQLQTIFPSSAIMSVDIADQMLRCKKMIYPVVADFDDLPFADQSVDIIVANLCVQWSPVLSDTLKAWRRVLKPNGILLFSTLLQNSLNELRSSFQQTLMMNAESFDPLFLSREQVHKHLMQESFRVMEEKSFQPVLYFPTVRKVLQSLKHTGTNPPSSRISHHLLGKQHWRVIENHYQQFENDLGLPLTYDVLCVSASI